MISRLEVWGERLVVFSTFLFAVSIPTSMALDNIASGIGLLGLLFLLISKKLSPFPSLKPLLFLLVPQLLEALIKFPAKIFKTDFNLHLVPYFTVYRTLLKKDYLEKLLLLLAISSIVLSFSVIFEAFTWQNIKHIDWSSLEFHADTIRPRGLLNHWLTSGGVLFLLFTLFTGAFLYFRKLLYLTVSIFLFVALIFDGSRSYWLGLGMFLILLVISIGKKRKEVWVAVLSLVFLGVLSVNIPFVKHRFESITNTKDNWSNLERLMIWNSHFNAFIKDYSFTEKLFGAGYKADDYAWKRFSSSFEKITGKHSPSEKVLRSHFHGGETHNIYLKFLTKYGIVGLLGYIAFWGIIFYENLRNETKYDVLIKTLLAGYVGFLVAGFFENNFTDAEIQFALMFILGLNFALNSEPKNECFEEKYK